MDGQKILVTDDEPDMNRIISHSLSLEGFEVIVADNGTECLRKVATYQPDLILLDILMPGLQGLEVLAQLKSKTDTKDIPVVMLTALSERQHIDTAMSAGADDYIVKPFDHNILIAKVKRGLSERAAVAPV